MGWHSAADLKLGLAFTVLTDIINDVSSLFLFVCVSVRLTSHDFMLYIVNKHNIQKRKKKTLQMKVFSSCIL